MANGLFSELLHSEVDTKLKNSNEDRLRGLISTKTFENGQDLLQHKEQNFKIKCNDKPNLKRYVCKFIAHGKRTSSNLDLKSCTKVIYKCGICEMRFPLKSNLDTHMEIHAGEQFSEKTLSNQSKAATNLDNVSIDVQIGGKISSQVARSSKHKIYQCDICENSFSDVYHLRKHELIHTDELPCKCDICGKKFALLNDFIIHTNIHTGEQPFKCHVCEEHFSRKIHLKMHRKIHTGERPHKCTICEKDFSKKASLTKHKKLHTRQQSHHCHICKKSFSTKFGLNTHLTVHQGEKSDN